MVNTQTDFEWAVVGAGPAGIAAVGKLLDNHVKPENIAWIDPAFSVGDFGLKWRKVPSNTKVSLFTRFLNASHAFQYADCQENFALHSLDPDKTCELRFMADPLFWVSERLKQRVHSIIGKVDSIKPTQHGWSLLLGQQTLSSKRVILAIGAEPKTLPLHPPEIVPLDITFDPEELSKVCTSQDTVAVFGSSHSAVLIIRNLIEECHVKKVINFYQSPLCYAVYEGDQILFDDSGLKGTTAEWARQHIDGTLPGSLQRIISTSENLQRYLTECSKAVHAVGFKKRHVLVEGLSELHYDDKTGVIAPGLYGFGIAFPESKTNHLGNVEYRVGLWKFMDYITRMMPEWVSD